MSNIKKSDFYYGSVLATLFSHNVVPALVENGESRRIYKFTTNNGDFIIKDDISTLTEFINSKTNVLLALVCATEDLKNSELACLDSMDIKNILFSKKESITISRKRNKKFFKISVDRKVEDGWDVKANKLDEFIACKE
jgi:hypothetical protein